MTARIAAATGLALALRLIGLGSDSLWGDEAFTWHMTTLPWRDVVASHGSVNTPAYYVLAKVSTALLGESEAALRLPAALFMAAAVPFIALLALRIRGPRAAVVSAFVAALAPALIHYGQEARAYALLVFGSAATLVAYARAIEARPGRARDVAALGLSAAFLLYAHPYGALEAAGLGTHLVGRSIADRRCPRAAFLGLALAGALFAPYVPVLLGQAGHVAELPWLESTSIEGGAEVPGKLVHWGRGALFIALFGTLAILACVLLPRPWRRLALMLALFCWVGPAVHSRLGTPVFRERYAMGLAPLAAAAIGCLVARAWERRRRTGLAAGAAILLALAADAIAYHATRPHRADWRKAFAELKRAREEGATPVIVVRGTARAAAYYFRGPAEMVGDVPKGTRGPLPLGPLPPGRIAVVATAAQRAPVLEAAGGRPILREMPRRSRHDPLFLVIGEAE